MLQPRSWFSFDHGDIQAMPADMLDVYCKLSRDWHKALTLKPIFIYVWIQISSKAWLGSWLGISFRTMLITQFGCWSNVWFPHDSNQICDRGVQLHHLLRVRVRALWYPHIFMASFVDAVICMMLKTDISSKGRRKISVTFQVRKYNCRERFNGKFIKPQFWASSKDLSGSYCPYHLSTEPRVKPDGLFRLAGNNKSRNMNP